MTLKQQLSFELEKASPEVLRQVFEFLQFLKRIEKNAVKKAEASHPVLPFIGCMAGAEGDLFMETLQSEFSKIEGEW